MAELTAQHTGQTVERILADGDRDRWFTAQEAREYGMVDEVIAPTQTERPNDRAGEGPGPRK
jgi:ATP-dependent Clp protease protease subunit